MRVEQIKPATILANNEEKKMQDAGRQITQRKQYGTETMQSLLAMKTKYHKEKN